MTLEGTTSSRSTPRQNSQIHLATGAKGKLGQPVTTVKPVAITQLMLLKRLSATTPCISGVRAAARMPDAAPNDIPCTPIRSGRGHFRILIVGSMPSMTHGTGI